jgi:hypothetical protein
MHVHTHRHRRRHRHIHMHAYTHMRSPHSDGAPLSYVPKPDISLAAAVQYKQLGEASNETDLVLDQQGASMQQNPMSKTDVRTAQGIAHMARMRAAAEAAAQPVQDEVPPPTHNRLSEKIWMYARPQHLVDTSLASCCRPIGSKGSFQGNANRFNWDRGASEARMLRKLM